MQVYEFSLNVSKGSVGSNEAYGIFRSDATTIVVEVGKCVLQVVLVDAILCFEST